MYYLLTIAYAPLGANLAKSCDTCIQGLSYRSCLKLHRWDKHETCHETCHYCEKQAVRPLWGPVWHNEKWHLWQDISQSSDIRGVTLVTNHCWDYMSSQGTCGTAGSIRSILRKLQICPRHLKQHGPGSQLAKLCHFWPIMNVTSCLNLKTGERPCQAGKHGGPKTESSYTCEIILM